MNKALSILCTNVAVPQSRKKLAKNEASSFTNIEIANKIYVPKLDQHNSCEGD